MATPHNWPSIRAGIFAGESGGDMDALFGFSNRRGGRFANTRLRDMTVDQALQFADPRGEYAQWVKGQIGRVATPMGGYQIVGSTLREAKDDLGLTGAEKMDDTMQERLGQWVYARQGTNAWEGYRGPGDPSAYAAPDPYAAMPDGKKGEEMYAPPAAQPPSLMDKAAQALGLAPPTADEARSINAQRNGDEQESLLGRLGRALASIEGPRPMQLSGGLGATGEQQQALTQALNARGSLAQMFARKRMTGR